MTGLHFQCRENDREAEIEMIKNVLNVQKKDNQRVRERISFGGREWGKRELLVGRLVYSVNCCPRDIGGRVTIW